MPQGRLGETDRVLCRAVLEGDALMTPVAGHGPERVA